MNHEPVKVSLTAAEDKTNVSEKENIRHVVFTLTVSRPLTAPERRGLAVALVLDRSGSMHGGKIEAAKQAANMVVQALDNKNGVSIVCFDEQIDVLRRGYI
ncbi:MAG: VWA domain-containing protein [Spirochaetales bacterium]|nr:MAG: VWA domain-containing protein [Spirochaetales bacterium]